MHAVLDGVSAQESARALAGLPRPVRTAVISSMLGLSMVAESVVMLILALAAAGAFATILIVFLRKLSNLEKYK
tara:strand:+ start:1843 stop:2064 length:222 start_codon:yes stop_codon:yes gene_type:complete